MISRRTMIAVAGTLFLAIALAGVVYAEKEMPKPGMKVEEEAVREMPECCEGMGMGQMMPDLPPETEKALIEQEKKFVKETSPLRADLQVKRLEMRELWLDEKPNQDKLLAKLREIGKLRLALEEAQLKNRLAIYGIMPAEHRKMFLRMSPGMGECCPMPGMGECCPMPGMGQKMMIRKNVRIERPGPGGAGPDQPDKCPGCPMR